MSEGKRLEDVGGRGGVGRGFDDQTSLSVPSVLDLVGSFSAVIHR